MTLDNWSRTRCRAIQALGWDEVFATTGLFGVEIGPAAEALAGRDTVLVHLRAPGVDIDHSARAVLVRGLLAPGHTQ